MTDGPGNGARTVKVRVLVGQHAGQIVLVERSFCGQDADRHGGPGRGEGRGRVRIIPDPLRPAHGSTASLPTPRGARLHSRETIPRPTLLR